jgi:hypothetical protein
MNNPDYGKWAKSKTFKVGDTIGTPPLSLSYLSHKTLARCAAALAAVFSSYNSSRVWGRKIRFSA